MILPKKFSTGWTGNGRFNIVVTGQLNDINFTIFQYVPVSHTHNSCFFSMDRIFISLIKDTACAWSHRRYHN